MPYIYSQASLQNINKDGTTLGPALVFTTGTTPVQVAQFAIGNLVQLKLQITRVGGDNFTNKALRINLSQFGPTNVAGDDFGFETNGFVTGVATLAQFKGGSDGLQLTRRNITATFQLLDPNTVEIVVNFYMTCDVGRYISTNYFVQNQVRFLQARLDYFANALQNTGSTVYNLVSDLGITTRVYNFTTFNQFVLNQTTLGGQFWDIPFTARWYNSDYLADVTDMRYIESLSITSPSQITNGLPTLTDITSTGTQSPADANTDSAFTVNRNQLSPSETNTVSVVLQGLSLPGGGITTVDNIRCLLIRTDEFTNNALFTDTYDMSEAIIPAAAGGTAQLDKALYTPSSWAQNGGTGEITLTFDIDGTELETAREYRLIICLYENANPDRPTSHISPPLVTTYAEPVLPTITGYLATYAEEFATNELQNVAPHQRIRCRLEIDKTSYATGLAALGLTGSFDESLTSVSAELVAIPGVIGSTVEGYVPNTLTPPLDNSVITNGMQIITDDASTFSISSTFRIEEERANTTAFVRWNIRLRQPTNLPGSFAVYDIRFEQLLGVRFFENDSGLPALLDIKFLDGTVYPAQKIEVVDICDTDFIIAEIEKDPAILSGSVNLMATIYPADETGDTTPPQIEEEEDWQPANPPLPQLVSGKLDMVEISFGGDDFATWRINTQQLTEGQRYWVTGIVVDQVPDYCPVGLVALTLISTQRPATAFPGWFVVGDPNPVIAEILAHPQYTGGLNIVYNRIVDDMGNLVGLQSITGDVCTATAIDQSLTDVWYELRIDAGFDAGSGTHTVSHVLRVNVLIPPVNVPPVLYNSNAYVCTDLG